MHLLACKALYRWSSSNDYGAYLSAEQVCPVCRSRDEFTTKPRRNAEIMMPRQRAELLVADLDQPRTCRNCGVVSRLPEVDRERLEREVEAKITRKWLVDSSRDFFMQPVVLDLVPSHS